MSGYRKNISFEGVIFFQFLGEDILNPPVGPQESDFGFIPLLPSPQRISIKTQRFPKNLDLIVVSPFF